MLKGSSHSGYQAARQDSSSGEDSEGEEETFLGVSQEDPREEEEEPSEEPSEEQSEEPSEEPSDVSPSRVSVNLEMTSVHVLSPSELDEDNRQGEEEEVDVAPPSYDVVKGKAGAPPDYAAATRDEGASEARGALQDTSASAASSGPPLELSVMGEDDGRPRSREAWVAEDDGTNVQNAANEDIEARETDDVDESEDGDVPRFIPDPLRPAFRQVRMFRPGVKTALTTLINFCIALFLLLIILSIQKLDYTQMGFKMKRVSHFVYFMDDVFEAGRYFIGPSNIFKPYSAVAHTMEFEDIRIYTTDPLRISFRCHFHFFLKKTELGLLEEELDRYYLETINKTSISVIKNSASQFSVDQFLTQRAVIESFVHQSLREALEGTCCVTRSQCQDFTSCHACYAATGTNCSKGLHIEVPFFNLLFVNLPDAVLSRKQQVLITALGGEEEVFHQTAALTRKYTEKLVQDIRNEAAFVSANGTAYASVIRVKANAEAKATINLANSQGLTGMYSNLSITEEDHKASVHWLRTLRNQENLITGMNFEEYIKLTNGN
ncbi:hypothetical protein BSL78_11633 [Apostichopus japonicus]|uniref:Band 7 domain-containing protein n=1 Tax=Stichopus japonicus TaxID=307972 RepID=A0A2G8KTX4_STIJA|nr:hypothetical protein BSL78_11633 [Apostichopus japonicus]